MLGFPASAEGFGVLTLVFFLVELCVLGFRVY